MRNDENSNTSIILFNNIQHVTVNKLNTEDSLKMEELCTLLHADEKYNGLYVIPETALI